MEAHTLSTLNAVLFALSRIASQSWEPSAKPPVDFNSGQMSLARQAESLLGLPAGKRTVKIMVRMPSDAASDPTLIRELLAAGMDVMRINCAHDGPDVWAAMVNNLRRLDRVNIRELDLLRWAERILSGKRSSHL